MNKLVGWLVGRPSDTFESSKKMAALIVFLIVAYCFNVLPPDFSFDGISRGGAEGSLYNQVFWGALMLMSLPSVLGRSKVHWGVYVHAMPLLILCTFFLLSAIWSLDPAISFRRAVLEFMVVGCVLVNVASLERAEQAFVILYRVASITLCLELVMLFRENGFDEFGLFRGIHSHKNVLGLVSVIAIFSGFWVRSGDFDVSRRWVAIYLILWFVLLVLSQSKTSLGLLIAIPLFAISIRRWSAKIGVGIGAPLVVIIAIGYCFVAIGVIAGFDVGGGVEDWISSVGFTGRDHIWHFLIARILEAPWLGYGYGGFWDIGPDAPNVKYGTGYMPMINQAHNGYLDILLAGGMLGLAGYLLVLAAFVRSLSLAERTVKNSVLGLGWIFVTFSFFHNFTESSALRGYALVWVIQLLAMAVTYRLAHEASKPV